MVVIPLVFSPFCCQYFLYLPRVFFCEFTSLAFIFDFPTERTWSISFLNYLFCRICPFFHSSSISYRVNSYRFFLSDKFVLFCFVYLLLVFSSRPLQGMSKLKVFADILRPFGTTILLVLIVFIVPGKKTCEIY